MARRWIAVGLALLGMLVLAVGAWGIVQFNSIDRVGVDLAAANADAPLNFLIVGSDTRELESTSSSDAAGIFGSGDEVAPGGKRADTIVIARVNPKSGTIELLSVPRDLWVTSSAGKQERINSAYNAGPQELIDVIKRSIGVSINHYVEVNFDGFKGLVEAVGGVPMYFGQPVRDRHTGLNVKTASCVNMDGVQALAFARSRHLQVLDDGSWRNDPTGDLGRITRQQIFLRRAIDRATQLNLTDLNTLRQLIAVGVQNVRLDDSLGIDDMTSLARRFASFDASTMAVHHLATQPVRTKGGSDVLEVDRAGSRDVLAIFQGKPVSERPTTTLLAAESVTVDVLNTTATNGLARNAADLLASAGFTVGEVGNGPTVDRTVISYGNDARAQAERLAHALEPAPKLRNDPDLDVDAVQVELAGVIELTADAVSEATLGQRPAQSGAGTSASASASTGGAGPVGTAAVPDPNAPIGLTLGDPPAGVTCG